VKNQGAILKITGVVFITFLTVVIYHHAFFNGFVSDDGFQILANPWIKDIKFIPGIFGHSLSGFSAVSLQKATYRPMMYAAFTIEHSLFGLNPIGWHAVNILVHALNGVLVFLITLKLLRSFTERSEPKGRVSISTWLSAIVAAALFISHPAGSEPVSWVSALPELSFTFLVLAAFYIHIRESQRAAKPAIARYAVGPILFFIALLFKETAIVLPLILFIHDILARRDGAAKRGNQRFFFVYGAYSFALAAYIGLRFLALGHLGSGTNLNAYLGPGGLFLNAVAGFYKAFILIYWPMWVYPFQIFKPIGSPFELGALIPIIFTSALISAIFILRKKLHPLVLLAIAIMVLPIIPALYTPVMSRFDFAPRYIYLSTAGYGIFLAFIVRWLFRKGPLRGRFYLGGLAVVLSWLMITVCAFMSAGNSLDWSDNMSLAQAALRGSSDNYYALYQIGNAEQGRGRYNEAQRRYTRAIGIIEGQEHKDLQTLRDSLLRFAVGALQLGQTEKAIGVYEKILGLWPDNATALYQLGYIYQGQGGYEKAIFYYGKAFTAFKDPKDKRDTLINMGNCYARLTSYEEAYGLYGKALEIDPANSLVRRNMETIKGLMEAR